MTIAESTVTTTSPATVTVTSVQAATAVMLPAKVTLTSPAKVTSTSPARVTAGSQALGTTMSPTTVPAGSETPVTTSPQTVPTTLQVTSGQVSTAVTVGLPEPVTTAGLTVIGIPPASVAVGWLVKTVTTTVPQEKTIDTTDLDTTPSKVNRKVVIQFLSVKYLNVS